MPPKAELIQDARRHDIDWLRIFATYLLLLFHVAMVFNPAPFYHVRNGDVSFFFLILCGFISLFHMPLFFLLAGWSAFASLSMRGTGDFLKERFFRLFIPLLASCVVLMPAIKYLELSSGLDANYTGLYVEPALQESFRQVIPSGLPVAQPFDESFFEFLPTFYTNLSRFTWAHLWFVAYLITFTTLYLPLFAVLLRPRDWFNRRIPSWWVYAPIFPLAIIQITMRERWPGLQNLIDDWANFAYYSTFLIAGFLLARFPALEATAHNERKRALAIGLASTLVLLIGVLGAFSSPGVMLANTAVAGWCFVVACLGWARHMLSFKTTRLPYLRESAFPVYLLHQSAIVIPGYFLIQLPLGVWIKFPVLLAVASILTLATYHVVVRPFTVPRFLFGMKTRTYARRLGLAPTLASAGVLLAAVIAMGTAESNEGDPVTASPIGLWYAEGGAAKVDLRECSGELCGRVLWLRSPFDENGCELRDRYNPDESMRHRAVIGLDIVRGLTPSPTTAAAWQGGTIYDPGSGRTYSASLRVISDNRIELRGFVGIPMIGRTTSWFRVGSEQEVCQHVV